MMTDRPHHIMTNCSPTALGIPAGENSLYDVVGDRLAIKRIRMVQKMGTNSVLRLKYTHFVCLPGMWNL